MTHIEPGGAAQLAGVSLGDCILAVNDTPVKGMQLSDVTALMALGGKPDAAASGSAVTLALLPGAALDAVASVNVVSSPDSAEQGIDGKGSTRAVSIARGADGRLGLALSIHVVVARVDPTTAAAFAGVRVGERLLAVTGQSLGGKSADEVRKLIGANKALQIPMRFGECTLRA